MSEKLVLIICLAVAVVTVTLFEADNKSLKDANEKLVFEIKDKGVAQVFNIDKGECSYS